MHWKECSVGLGGGASKRDASWYFDEIDIEGRNRIASEFFASIHSAINIKLHTISSCMW